jgi:hypothetical protein
MGGMTLWAPVDKQAAGKPGRAGRTTEVAPVSLVTWCDMHGLKELAQWAGWVRAVAVGRAQFQGLNILFQYFYYSKFDKYKSCASYYPMFSKLYQVVDNFKRGNFTFRKKFKFST